MVIIDAQVHAYERNHPGRPWAGVLTGPAEVTGDDMVAAMDAVGVASAVLVSPFTMYGYEYGYDASYALEVYRQHPARFTLVKPVDPADPGVAETIADWAAQLAARHPQTQLMIDHLRLPQPQEPSAPADPFADLPKLLPTRSPAP
jgi:predicted TIM-barrel fold metal-dependent hydrolase